MPTLNHIFLKQELTARYLHLLYHFPRKKFFRIVGEMSEYYGIDLTDFFHHELYAHGLIRCDNDIRDVNYQQVRWKVKRYLLEHPVPVRKRKEKRPDILQRAGIHRREIKEMLRFMGFTVVSDIEAGLVLWNRDMGILIVTGTMWCYVYETGRSIRWTKNYPLIGYFNLTRGDYKDELLNTMEGKRTWRAWALSKRRMFYEMRRHRQHRNINIKMG